MGEYAKYKGASIKIGTNLYMYYLRYEDRFKVKPEEGSLNPTTLKGLYWRLPFPDEDHMAPGEYPDFYRGVRLFKLSESGAAIDYRADYLAEHPGIIQMYHSGMGLLANIRCYHGMKLPENSDSVQFHWNGRSHCMELVHVLNTAMGMLPVIACKHCRTSWSLPAEDWPMILEHVQDQKLRERLKVYASSDV
jgi:hypothetical protein